MQLFLYIFLTNYFPKNDPFFMQLYQNGFNSSVSKFYAERNILFIQKIYSLYLHVVFVRDLRNFKINSCK